MSGTNVFHTEASPEENPVHLIMNQLLKLQEKQTAKTDFTTSTLLHELLNELLLQKFQLNFEDTEIPAYISDLKDDLEKNFKQALTLDELARKSHRNQYHLNKEISRFVGSLQIDFKISKKSSYAKDLLRYSDLTIQQVAGTVGMDNAAYFSRLFKLRTGLTPSHYRKIGT